MKTQRLVGLFLGAFCAVVVLGHLADQSLSWFDFIIGGFVPIFALSAMLDHWSCRILQVAMIAGAAICCVVANGTGTELAAFFFSQAFILAYVHGFLDRNLPLKAVLYALGVFQVFFIASPQMRVPVLLLILCLVVVAFQWAIVQHFVEKAHRLDALEKDELFKKFTRAVDAGLSIAENDEEPTDVTPKN